MTERSKPKHSRQDPAQGEFSGTLPVIRGKLTKDEIDALAEKTQTIGPVKEFRERGY